MFSAGTEDETKENVEAADGKEEECGNEREVVDVMRKNGSADATMI